MKLGSNDTKIMLGSNEVPEIYLGNNLVYQKSSGAEIVTSGNILWLAAADFINSPLTTSWIDKSGNGNNVTPYGFAYTNTSGNDGNGYVTFDGTDDYATSPNITINQEMTYEVIYMPGSTITYNMSIIDHRISGAVGIQPLSIASDGTISFIDSAKTSTLTASKAYKFDGKKHSLVATGNASEKSIYLDGIKVASDAIGISAYTARVMVIGRRYAASGYADIKLSAVRVYNRRLTDEEIIQNYNASI